MKIRFKKYPFTIHYFNILLKMAFTDDCSTTTV